MPDTAIPVLQAPPQLFGDDLVQFGETLDKEALGVGPGVVIDLSQVTFVGSEGLGAMIRFGMSLDRSRRRLALTSAPRRVARILQTVGLGDVLPLFRNLESARAYITEGAS